LENSLTLLRNGRQVHFIFLPDNEDPDSFVRENGKESFLSTKMLVPLSEFLFNSISQKINLEILEGRSEMINKTLPYLNKLPPDPYKDIIMKELSKITSYEINDIKNQLSKAIDLNSKTINKKNINTKNKILFFIKSFI